MAEVSGRTTHRKGGGGSATSRGILFQQRVGTLFAAWLLSERPIDSRLGLGDAKVASVGMETDAPVDDILALTSERGHVAVQAKTGLSLSANPGRRFHDTITQFVRHRLACAQGEGEQGWNRPLNPAIDRLVVAVNPATPSTVRQDLPAALRHLRGQRLTTLSASKQRALHVFRACVEDAWFRVTGKPPAAGLVAEMAQLVEVFEFDATDIERIELVLGQGLPETTDASAVLNALDTTVAEMMENGESADSATLRSRVTSKGVTLAVRRHIANDVQALRDHSASVAEQLHPYEQIPVDSDRSESIPRECQSFIEQAALEGSLLIVGEAGIGKSAVLNALGRTLRERGLDVVQLAVDRHSVQTLEGLGRELRLEHDLIEVIDGWDGSEPAWLLIDGLDAARGSETEGVFRILIKRTIELGGRWRVAASIRSFDLQMGQEIRRLFKGEPPVAELSDVKFGGVRHISVPGWTDSEFAVVLDRAPALRSALTNAPRDLVELARVPFNTNLIGELLDDGVDALRLVEVASQAQLLRIYWEHRIQGYGTPAQVCLFKTVEAMVAARALRAAKHEVDFGQPHVFDDLSSVGVLMSSPDESWVQFRHHILFDFAAARCLLASERVGGHPDLRKDCANGLLLAPAMRFVLQELWEKDGTRQRFWSAMESMLTDESSDPVIGIAAARTAAELPSGVEDLEPLMERIAGGSGDAAGAFQRIAGALVIAMEDEPERCIQPWVAMLSKLAPHVGQVANVFRFLLFRFVERADDARVGADIGIAARALLDYALAGEDASFLARPAIGFVTTTYHTDPGASRRLLRAVFDETRFERFGAEEIPAVCEGAKAVMASDPEFVAEIYALTYGRDVTQDRETSMSASQILPLRSTARQDYGMARYQLETLFEEFLVAHPKQAIQAVEDAVEAYLARRYPIPESAGAYDIVVSGWEARLREDVSYLWAHDPYDGYAEDAPALVVKLLDTLKSCREDLAIEIADNLIGGASLAVFWSRAFAAAAERGDGLLDLMLPYALEEPLLMAFETRKDAIDVIAKGYGRLSVGDRETFERRVLSLEFERHGERAMEARQACLETVFGSIGCGRLATEEAKRILTGGDRTAGEESANERPFRIVTGWRGVQASDDAMDTDDTGSDGASASAVIRAAEETMAGGTDQGQRFPGSFDEACAVLEEVERIIRGESVDGELVRRGEGVIGQGCLAICNGGLLPAMQDEPRTERYVRLLKAACSSRWPVVEADTEAGYEELPSWGAPAPRVEAAEGMLRTLGARPDLHARLAVDLDRLLADPHPAVRMYAGVNLGQIADSDPAGFRNRLSSRIRRERNAAVLEYMSTTVLRGVVSRDAAFAESLVLELLERSTGDSKAVQGLRTSLAANLTLLGVTYRRGEGLSVIEGWMSDCAAHHRELGQVLTSMREGYTLGLRSGGSSRDEALRQRCLDLASRIAEAAAADLTARVAQVEMPDAEIAMARQSAQLLDRVCGEFNASVVGREGRNGSSESPDPGLGRFLAEASPILVCLAGAGTPHTVYRLLEILDYLMPLDPGKVFDIAMHATLDGGRRSGFQFESMGADRLVGIVGRLLADHRQDIEVEGRRQTLVRCLDLFASAGWPSASRLLFRLPELFR